MRHISMKLLAASAMILAIIVPTVQAFSLTGDFITGFESGIFLRNDPKMFEDYGCPDAANNNEQFKQLK